VRTSSTSAIGRTDERAPVDRPQLGRNHELLPIYRGTECSNPFRSSGASNANLASSIKSGGAGPIESTAAQIVRDPKSALGARAEARGNTVSYFSRASSIRRSSRRSARAPVTFSR
jgi:hypothetical protein